MFRKPKKGTKKSFRNNKRKTSDADSNNAGQHDEDDETTLLIAEARNAAKKSKVSPAAPAASAISSNKVMHHFQPDSSSVTKKLSASELATSTAQHHPEEKRAKAAEAAEKGDDGIFRDSTRNKFLAGPIKASTFVRTTARFDYQPDICKDYKETGFCGFGDTCIYLHDRGDTLSGWQIEQQWEEQQRKKREKAQKEIDAFAEGGASDAGSREAGIAAVTIKEDGIPFACHICRKAFANPVVTSCSHYFCEKCIMDHVRNDDKGSCPICKKDTHGVFNQPTKLISKKRRLLGNKATWEEFANSSKSNTEHSSG